MAISIQKTSIEGLTLIHPHVFEDQRGYFIKDFEKSVYEQNDLPILFYECNESKSKERYYSVDSIFQQKILSRGN